MDHFGEEAMKYMAIAIPSTIALGVLGVLILMFSDTSSTQALDPGDPGVTRPPSDCPEGSFCGLIEEGTGTACSFRGCCAWDDGCTFDQRETVSGWPNVLSANIGNCIENGAKVNACKVTECLGNDCDPGPCTPGETMYFNKQYKPKLGISCGLDTE